MEIELNFHFHDQTLPNKSTLNLLDKLGEGCHSKLYVSVICIWFPH